MTTSDYQRVRRAFVAVFLTGTTLVSACVTPEQAERRDANAASDAASKSIVLDACYTATEAETENASSIIASQGGGDAVYWLWRPSWKQNTLAIVNAKATVDLNSSCLPRAEAGCASLGLEPVSGYVSRAQAAAGRGEFEVKCSPRLEQS